MSYFRPNDIMEQYIKDGDLKGLRESVGSIIYVDRSFKDGLFDNAVEYMKKHVSGFMQKFNPVPPLISEMDKESTEDDFAVSVSHLKRNFCDERINDVKTLSRRIYGDESAENNNSGAKTASSHHDSISKSVITKESEKNPPKKFRPTSLIAGIAGLAAIIAIIFLIIKAIKK